jgi:hypothetical protein
MSRLGPWLIQFHPSWLVFLLFLSACAVIQPRPPHTVPFAQGPFRVAERDDVFVDPRRPVVRAGGAPAPRRLLTRLWFPRDAGGTHPLVVYSHGFMSTRDGGAYLAETLASHGYVVAAPDHPLTRLAPCGRRADDVVNQPGDVSAVIDGVLGLAPSQRPFAGRSTRNASASWGSLSAGSRLGAPVTSLNQRQRLVCHETRVGPAAGSFDPRRERCRSWCWLSCSVAASTVLGRLWR